MEKANPASIHRSEQILGRADCLTTDAVGDIVRITGAKVGNRFQVAKVDISVAGDPPASAIIIKKPVPAGTDCVVQFDGPMRGTYTGLIPHSVYVVGTDGRLARTGDANFPGATDPVQQVGEATSSDELLISFQESVIAGLGGTTLVAGEALALGHILTTNASGEAIKASATFSSDIWRVFAVARAAAIAAASVLLATSGDQVPVLFASAPPASANRSVVFLSTVAGEGTLTPPFGSGEVVFVVGVLQGADGVTTTPSVFLQPQYIARTP